MALNFETAFNSNARSNSNGAQERPKTQIWLNIGFYAPMEVMKDGQKVVEERFVNLPVGIPIDTTEKVAISGTNKEWNEFQAARNYLLEMLQKHGAKMEEGAEETVQGLTIKLKRVAKPATVSDEENNLISFADIKFG